MILVERVDALRTLAEAFDEAAAGAGRLVLVSGEPGTGKTVLVRAAVALAECRLLWGDCDDLAAPAPLGPVQDALGAAPSDPAAADSRYRFSRAVIDELGVPGAPTVLVLDDVHWADTATLELVRYVARRIERTRGVLLLTYRNGETNATLRALLGEVSHRPAVRRVRLAPLSRAGVGELAEAAGADAEQTYRLSGGNPYVVSELLADPAAAAHSVGEAVLARADRLAPDARDVLDAVAVMSEGAEPAVLARFCGRRSGSRALDECTVAGLLVDEGGLVRFRHELARRSVLAAIAPGRRADLHAEVLETLLASGLGEPARWAHHAEAAGHRERVVRFARAAAQRAVTLGSHPEAAMQLERAFRFSGDESDHHRATLLDDLTEEYLLLDRGAEARKAADEALGLWRRAGDVARLGDCLRRRAAVLRHGDQAGSAVEAARAAVALLEPLGDSEGLAAAHAALAQNLMLDECLEEAEASALTASRLAEAVGAEDTQVHALTTLGSARATNGDVTGIDTLERSLIRARAAGMEAEGVRAENNLIMMRLLHDRFDDLRTRIESARDYAGEHGLEVLAQCMRSALARLALTRGEWNEACELARRALHTFGMASAQRIEPLIVVGTIRGRRGDPEPEEPLTEALHLARRTGEPQHVYPALRALTEVAWLAGDLDRAARYATWARATLEHAPRHPRTPELALWCLRAGVPAPPVRDAENPYGLLAAGRATEAAARWRDLGCPYEEADALAEAPDRADRRRAWALFDGLGASTRAAELARRLRAEGARDLPARITRPTATRMNPAAPDPGPNLSARNPAAPNPLSAGRAGLTGRQLQVAGLIASHLTNQEIAARLYLSTRTVDHHVSAILGKLQVGNRRHAAQRLRELGVTGSASE